VVPDDAGDRSEQVVAVRLDPGEIEPAVARRRSHGGELALVLAGARARVPEREALHRLSRRNLDEGRDRARVQATRETGPHRHVAAHPQPDRVLEQGAEALLGIDNGSLGARLESPVAGLAHRIRRDDETACRGQIPDACEERGGARVGKVTREEAADLVVIDPPFLRECGEDRLRLGREADAVFALRVAERLDPEAIARQHEPPLARVPEPERPHPVEALEAVEPP